MGVNGGHRALGDPNAKVIIFGLYPDPNKDRHHQHSMVLVPIETQGVTIERMLPSFGDYDAPRHDMVK